MTLLNVLGVLNVFYLISAEVKLKYPLLSGLRTAAWVTLAPGAIRSHLTSSWPWRSSKSSVGKVLSARETSRAALSPTLYKLRRKGKGEIFEEAHFEEE